MTALILGPMGVLPPDPFVVAARAAFTAAENEHDRMEGEVRGAWRAVLAARDAARGVARQSAEASDPALYAEISGRGWTTDGTCMVSRGWPLPENDPDRQWWAAPPEAAAYLAAERGTVDGEERFASRFAPTLRAGRVVGLADVMVGGKPTPGAVAVLDADGAIRAVVMPLRPETPCIRADGWARA